MPLTKPNWISNQLFRFDALKETSRSGARLESGGRDVQANADLRPANVFFMFRQFSRNFYTINSTLTKKKILQDGSILFTQEISNDKIKSPTDLPPRVRTFPTRAKLSNTQIEEIIRLRNTDPDTNTVLQLAKKFNTFPGFIMSVTQCPLERKQRLDQEAIENFTALPVSKKKRSIDRLRRKETW